MELTKNIPHIGVPEWLIGVWNALYAVSEVYVDHAYARPWLNDAARRGHEAVTPHRRTES